MAKKKVYDKIDKTLELFGLENSYYSHFSMRSLEGMSGVYILWWEDNIRYIGQGDDVGEQLRNSHHTYGYSVSIVPVVDSKLRKEVERALIAALSPPENKES